MSRLSDFSRAHCHPERSEKSPNLVVRIFVPAAARRSLCGPGVFVRFLASLGMTAVILCSGASLVYAQEQSATSVSHQVREIFERSAKAVVKIHGVDEHSEISGTGFFIDPTGTLYTAYTVGGEAENFTIEFNGKKYPARQLLADIRSGTAMLKIDTVTPALAIGKSEELEVATPVVSIGYPLDLPETPNFGMVAGLDHKYLGRYFSTTHLRLNLPTQRGEAGAPLLNMKGEVVGIVVSSLENNSACYAVPIEAAEKIRGDFVRFGEARHGWVGINVSDAPTEVEGSRAEMTQMMEGTPAANSGIKPGDILLQVGRKKVTQPEDVLDASFFITAGDTVPITVMRGNRRLTFSVRAALHPASQRGVLIASPASPTMNQGLPLKLESEAQRTP
jgi:S1-C subfamily serine protease